MGHFDKPSDKLQGRAGAILEDHVNMSDSHCGEVYNALPTTISEISSSKLPMPFKNVLAHFHQRNVGPS
jgi:hypothetical protein